MIRNLRRKQQQEAELDITSFMNLMIILVPVLLMSMVFSHITVLNINLPEILSGGTSQEDRKPSLELVIRESGMQVNYPAGTLLKRVPKTEEGLYDFALLTDVLKEIKRQFREKDNDTKAITILSEANIDYQTIVTAMDKTRSYKAVVAASLVDAELFPEISLGDAPAASAKARKTASANTNDIRLQNLAKG